MTVAVALAVLALVVATPAFLATGRRAGVRRSHAAPAGVVGRALAPVPAVVVAALVLSPWGDLPSLVLVGALVWLATLPTCG
ncbi:hypothetical protein [Nostocoides sp. Soil756]|uniref:hypothetical protein n=1 Tax=Nostocoides sp. Soil756 TaxID=1736399 RepID=UPI00070218D0|nr:hypothetical protein [Tetrasphaera sp. Soil756]KRE60990.1 hypothetical protein ASG78_11550 [Tetrasphaera sp. Soil756]